MLYTPFLNGYYSARSYVLAAKRPAVIVIRQTLPPPRLALHKVIKKMFDYAAMFGVGALILFSNNEESLKNIKIGYLTAEGKTMLPVDRNFWGTGMGVIKGLRDNCRRP